MNNIYMKVTAYVGSGIRECLQDARRVSKELGINVQMDFNGVTCIVNGSSDVNRLCDAYSKELVSHHQHKIIS